MEKINPDKIHKIFDDFSRKKILVLGDIMLDAYICGNVRRISPEAPVPVVQVDRKEYRLGGAANVALNIKELGAEVELLSICGDDQEGEILKEIIEKQHIDSGNILKCKERKTTVKSRVIANNQQQLIRLDNEQTDFITRRESKKIIENVLAAMDDCDAIVFEDYDKGLLSAGMIRILVNEANKRNIPSIVDPKKRNFHQYKNCTLFKPNLQELRAGLNVQIDRPVKMDQIRKAAEQLFRKMNVQIAFITLSDEGVYINDRIKDLIVPSHKRSIYDVSGAGDTVTAVASLAISCGIENELLAQLTNIAGGLVCEKVGVVPVEKEEFYSECIRLLT